MAKAGCERVWSAAEAADGESEFPAQLVEVMAAAVLQFTLFEQVPDPFVGIEVGCVGGQPLQVQSFGRPSREEVFDRLAVMDRRAVPDTSSFPRT